MLISASRFTWREGSYSFCLGPSTSLSSFGLSRGLDVRHYIPLNRVAEGNA